MTVIQNAADTPLNEQPSGSLPQMGQALYDWFQPMVFMLVTKSTVAFQAVEVGENISFQGVMQPFTTRDLLLKPEGQRSWTWKWLHAETSLQLNTDEVVTYQGTQYRVMGLKNYAEYGYLSYELVQDWTGSGPTA